MYKKTKKNIRNLMLKYSEIRRKLENNEAIVKVDMV